MSTLPITSYRWPRFFSLMDTLKIQRPHEEYGRAVQAYFHSLFPHRQWSVFQDPDGTPLAVDVELLYPTVEEPFYLLHTIGMSAAPMHYPAGEFVTGKEGYGELCLILPADWPFRKDRDISLNDEEAWPIWLLMELGRFPHVHDVWMSYGFLLPNLESHEPYIKKKWICAATSASTPVLMLSSMNVAGLSCSTRTGRTWPWKTGSSTTSLN